MVSGEFSPEGSDDIYEYEVTSWFDFDGNQHTGTDYSQEYFMSTDRLIVRTTDGDNVRYSAIQGPFEDQEFIEDILAFDFGPDGSLQITSISG